MVPLRHRHPSPSVSLSLFDGRLAIGQQFSADLLCSPFRWKISGSDHFGPSVSIAELG